MITQNILSQRLSALHRNRFGFAHDKYLSPTGIKMKRFLRSLKIFVSRRQYILVVLERNKLLSELHWMAIDNNNLQDRLKEKK